MNPRSFLRCLLCLVAVVVFGEFVFYLFQQTIDPQIKTALTLSAVNGGQGDAASVRGYHVVINLARSAILTFYLVAFAFLGFCFVTSDKSSK